MFLASASPLPVAAPEALVVRSEDVDVAAVSVPQFPAVTTELN